MPLRIVAMLFCFCLIIKNYWPDKLRVYLPAYWYITIFYIMPFFFTFMLLKNNFSGVWVQNSMTALFFLILLVNFTELEIMLIFGIFLGWLCYTLTTSQPYIPTNLISIIAAYFAVIGVGSLFTFKRAQKQKEKLNTMHSLAIDIAHELRTPLAAINLAAEGTKDYLPELIKGYEVATNANLLDAHIRSSQLKLLATTYDDIIAETNYSNTIINMLLTNANQQNIQSGEFSICSISHCIEETLRRYPFQPGEKALINWNKEDFLFFGNEVLTVHMLFNLLKNAIYYLHSAQKGNITIWLSNTEKYNELHFRDTGKGISKDILPKIFDLFFSDTYHGSGIGLAFCKSVMQSYNGKIDCKSIEGEFTEFVLSFPKQLPSET